MRKLLFIFFLIPILAIGQNNKIIEPEIDAKTIDGLTKDSIVRTSAVTQTILGAKTFSGSLTGSYLTASEMLITNSSKDIVSAPVSAYPSLTELGYVKGLTSDLQTQLNLSSPTVKSRSYAEIATIETFRDRVIADGGSTEGLGILITEHLSADVFGISTFESNNFTVSAGVVELADNITLRGFLYLPETITPTAIADFGAFYTKADNIPYFQDGAGVEKILSTGSADYGEMGNVYGSSATEAITTADEWQAMYHANITGASPHLNSGFSFVAGSAGVIASIADAGGGDITVTDVAHTLLVGDYITINGCTDAAYNGVFEVLTAPTADTYTVTAVYTATDTGTWQMGSYLLVGTTGIYRGSWNASFSQSLNNTQTSITTPYINTTQSTKATASRLLANNTDVGSIGGNGLMSLTAGDRIWFAVQTTGAQTLTFTIRNMSIE